MTRNSLGGEGEGDWDGGVSNNGIETEPYLWATQCWIAHRSPASWTWLNNDGVFSAWIKLETWGLWLETEAFCWRGKKTTQRSPLTLKPILKSRKIYRLTKWTKLEQCHEWQISAFFMEKLCKYLGLLYDSVGRALVTRMNPVQGSKRRSEFPSLWQEQVWGSLLIMRTQS